MKPDELKQIAVLAAMDQESLARVAAALEKRVCADGEAVFNEGEPGDSMFFIAEGHIRIAKHAATASAGAKTLAILEAGDYFGEMALFNGLPRSASALASGPTTVLRFPKSAFDDLRTGGGQAGMSVLFAMIRTSSERIRRLSAEVIVYDEVGKAIGESRDLQALLETILRQLLFGTRADWGLLLLKPQFADRMELRARSGVQLTPEQIDAVGQGKGFLAEILRESADRLVNDFEADPALKSCERLGFETPSLLVGAISLEGQLLGLAVLGGHDVEHFDLNTLNLVRGVLRQTAQAILNARHREEEAARSRHSRQYVRF